MKKLIKIKLNELKKLSKQEFKLKPNVKIDFSLTSIRILGQYQYRYHKKDIIYLNEKLLNEFKEIYINEVLVHEYAHMIVKYKYGNVQSHGKEFKYICSILGVSGRATTNLFKDSSVLNKNKIKYKCKCTDHYLTRYKHNKIESGIKYRCGQCGFKLKINKEG